MNSSPLIIGYGSISEISEINEIRLNWINKGYIYCHSFKFKLL